MSSLYEKLVRWPNLKRAWDNLNKSNPQSQGLDGVTIDAFRQNLRTNIKNLQQNLKNGTLEFHPLRGHLIPKDGNDQRALKILSVRDRVLCHGILNLISRYFRKLNLKCSFAYIEGRGREKAIAEILRLREKGYWHVLEADIQHFFDEVNQNLLLDIVYSKLPDESLNKLIKESLDSEIGNKDRFTAEALKFFPDGTVGIPQGGILSPLFANAYLSSFDKEMTNQGFNLIRYADDFVVLCKSPDEAQRAYGVASQFLSKQLGLQIHELSDKGEGKTRITNFAEGFDFLGITFNHHTIIPSRKSRERFQKKLGELTEVQAFTNLLDIGYRLKLTISGWAQAYSFCHPENIKYRHKIMSDIFGSLDTEVRNHVAIILKHCDLLPHKVRGFHCLKLGIPSLQTYLNGKPLLHQRPNKRRPQTVLK